MNLQDIPLIRQKKVVFKTSKIDDAIYLLYKSPNLPIN